MYNEPRQLRALKVILQPRGGDQTTGGQPPEIDPERLIRWLYDILTIIDSKSSHTLTLTGLILAAQTFLTTILLDHKRPSTLDQVLADVFFDIPQAVQLIAIALLVIPLAASFYALWIFRINWQFLEWIDPGVDPRKGKLFGFRPRLVKWIGPGPGSTRGKLFGMRRCIVKWVDPGQSKWPEEEPERRLQDEIHELAKVCDDRVQKHTVAWWFTVSSVLSFLLIMVATGIDILTNSTGPG